ncbi:coagulation factor IX-like [Protopterus annectens]|uniref:coagulation factor IX-like n=1 Tax=Protopterus annectens TaxID=7888 RepID=UPI001CFA24AA|nr:coagulation factor IX-like [Protopterus annectens]
MTRCNVILLFFTMTCSISFHSGTTVFLGKQDASSVLRVRKTRANTFLEETKPGNLERECIEEVCSFEEAREVFGAREKTLEFWYQYRDFSPCYENPCQNGGVCKVQRSEFLCLCLPKYTGRLCETEKLECVVRNGECQQYCSDTTDGVRCSCAMGYQLASDGKMCERRDRFPCGLRQQDVWGRSEQDELDFLNETNVSEESSPGSNETQLTGNTTNGNQTGEMTDLNQTAEEKGNEGVRVVGGYFCQRGSCPWQVLIWNKRNQSFCGGSLISRRWILSAAHCFEDVKPSYVTLGDFDSLIQEVDEQKIQVEKVIHHPQYNPVTYNNDIVLIYLSQAATYNQYASPICLPNANLGRILAEKGTIGTVSGWGNTKEQGSTSRYLRKVDLPLVDYETCMRSTTQDITDNMFCAGYYEETKDACQGDSGGPLVVYYYSTWYLKGIISWGEGCAAKGKYGIYTRVTNYLPWIKETVQNVEISQLQPSQ